MTYLPTGSDPGARRPARRQASGVRVGVLMALVGALAAGSFAIPLPLLTVHPGPTPDVGRLITLDGTTYDSEGSFHMTTVSVRSASFVQALLGWAAGDVSVISREAIYPSGKSEEEVIQENAADMDLSGLRAAEAAFRELGMLGPPQGVLVVSLAPGVPAASVLEPGDLVVRAAGEPVAVTDELHAIVRRHAIGDELGLGIVRDDKPMDVTVELTRSEQDRDIPVIGFTPEVKYTLPREVTLEPGNIGGPSAGLMFALSVVDRLGPDDLTHGHVIAGTGTIDAEGRVGAVGGVPQKVEAAERLEARYFLAPADMDEADEARRHVDGEMEVIEVATIHDAVVALRELR